MKICSAQVRYPTSSRPILLLEYVDKKCLTHRERQKSLEVFTMGRNGQDEETISQQGIANHATEVKWCPSLNLRILGHSRTPSPLRPSLLPPLSCGSCRCPRRLFYSILMLLIVDPGLFNMFLNNCPFFILLNKKKTYWNEVLTADLLKILFSPTQNALKQFSCNVGIQILVKEVCHPNSKSKFVR